MRLIDLTGQRFHRLVAVRRITDTCDGRARWLCVCDCGGQKEVTSGNLRFGSVRSCGCYAREVASATAKITNAKQKGRKREAVTKPGSAFRSLFRAYRRDAERRSRSFNLTEDEFRNLTSGNCYYCGVQPSHEKKAWSGEVYTYNGIDRRHNEIGYEVGNCVSCCERCNRFKGRLDVDVFVSLCNIVTNHCTVGPVA